MKTFCSFSCLVLKLYHLTLLEKPTCSSPELYFTALLYPPCWAKRVLHLANQSEHKTGSLWVTILRLLNCHHLTSDSSVDSSRDPVSCKAQTEKWSEDRQKNNKILAGGVSLPFLPLPLSQEGSCSYTFRGCHTAPATSPHLSEPGWDRLQWVRESAGKQITLRTFLLGTWQILSPAYSANPSGKAASLIPLISEGKRKLPPEMIYKPTFILKNSCAINCSAVSLLESRWLACKNSFSERILLLWYLPAPAHTGCVIYMFSLSQ